MSLELDRVIAEKFAAEVEKVGKISVFSGTEANSEESFVVVKNRPKTINIQLKCS